MPMDRSRYPDNWNEIALGIKNKANWTCSRCGVKCHNPQEDLPRKLISLNGGSPLPVLTVHHADYDPSNNREDNLIPLCAPCHLLAHRWQKGNITQGQLKLNLGV